MFVEPVASIWNYWNQVDGGPRLSHGFSRGCAQEHLSGRTSPTFRPVGEKFFLVEGRRTRCTPRNGVGCWDMRASEQQHTGEQVAKLERMSDHDQSGEAGAVADSSFPVAGETALCLSARPLSGVGSLTRP
jgi:hypothetical protein